MQIEAALFVLIALHFQTSTQGLLKPESESAKFSVGAALRYLSTAIYTKALLQDNDPDKLFENAMMSASREDSDECVKRLLCELQGRLDDELSWDERLIKKSVTPSNDYAASYPQFQFAAYLGERQGSEKCNVVYTRCAFESRDIMELMRQRGTSLDLPIGDNHECTVVFLWHRKTDGSSSLPPKSIN